MTRLVVAVALLLAVAAAFWKTYTVGAAAGKATCEAAQAKANTAAEAVQKVVTQATVTRATAKGTQHERNRATLDHFFNQLQMEEHHAPADPVDTCVLPADRLRVWRDANDGRADQGATAAELDSTAAAAASTPVGSDARSGGESPGSDQGLPPAGVSAVPAAGLAGGAP